MSYVTVWVTTGEPETGLWCDRCLFPARIRIPVYLMTASGFTPLGVYDACTECDI